MYINITNFYSSNREADRDDRQTGRMAEGQQEEQRGREVNRETDTTRARRQTGRQIDRQRRQRDR